MPITVGAVRERDPAESRVAITPAVAAAWVKTEVTVLVETGAGTDAGYPDQAYVDAGAAVVTRDQLLSKVHVLVSIGRPDDDVLTQLTQGQALVGLLEAGESAVSLTACAERGAHILDLAALPRQISRAQTMDVLSSQASIAGYRAAIVAAEAYGRYFPMMVTAAGTAKPASVLVLGAGVAGLQAIATARRLGARVTGYDVRPAAREEVTSLGAQFLTTSVSAGDGEGGYARELSAAEAAEQQSELAAAIAKFDIVITTARVPGRQPPLLVNADTVAAMKRGSVIVDLAAGPLGGNVAGVVPNTRTVTTNGVTILGAGTLASDMAPAASDAFAKNLAAVVASIIDDGNLVVDPADEVIGAMLILPARETQGVSA